MEWEFWTCVAGVAAALIGAGALVGWELRGWVEGRRPAVVLETYHNPFPVEQSKC